MKDILNILGLIFLAVLIPYLIASLLEWNLITKYWHEITKLMLVIIYSVIITFIPIIYLNSKLDNL